MCVTICTNVFAAPKKLDTAVSKAGAYLQKLDAPTDWGVFGLARSELYVPPKYYENYYNSLVKTLKEKDGKLSKSTDYAKLVTTLAAAGYDPTDTGGYDLTAPLSDFNAVTKQGLNGAVWALIALDSGDYNVSRSDYINEILDKQLEDGGFGLSQNSSDVDITAMALSALAKYTDRKDAANACERAAAYLRAAKTDNAESAAQTIIAFSELGIDPTALVNALISYQKKDGGFSHGKNDKKSNAMSSEQAFCALVAAQRYYKGESSLYRLEIVKK